jgi:hypothetical protein
MRLHSRLLAASLACGITLLPTVPAFAAVAPEQKSLRINVQNDTPDLDDFVVGPTRFILPMKPGEERTVELQLTNRMGQNIDFELLTEDFFADPAQDGTPSFFEASLEGPYPARLWLIPELRTFTLHHADRAFLTVTVRVPADAEPGDHQAAVIVKQREPEGPQKSGIAIVPRVASLFIVSVEGDVTRDASLVSLSSRKKLNWWLPVNMSLSAKNNGSVHFSANGLVEIRNLFGIVVDEIPVKNWIVLRNSGRTRDIVWSPRFALGRYTATTDLTLYTGMPTQQLRTSFWVIPMLPLLIILFVIFFISFVVQYFFSRFEIHRKRPAQESQPPPDSKPSSRK